MYVALLYIYQGYIQTREDDMKHKRKNSEQAQNWIAPIGMGIAMGASFGVAMNDLFFGIAMGIGMTFAFYPVFNQSQSEQSSDNTQKGD